MLKRLFLLVAASGVLLSASAADYFPVETGNAWTFSYTSTSMPVVPNPLITKDSGTVKWEVVSNSELHTSMTATLLVGIKQTRSLMRRSQTRSDTSVYDSVYSLPRTTIDTVRLYQPLLASNAIPISFENDTCPFAVHYPTVAMPSGLSSKDTAVSFQGTTVAGKKMIVSECSCLKSWYSYSFILGPDIGPVEAYIGLCPGIVGGSVKETWKLISREYPTSVVPENVPRAVLKTVAAKQFSGRITCSFNSKYSSPVQIELIDPKGRLIKTLFKGSLNAGVHRYSWNIPAKTCGIAVLRVRTGAGDRCVRIVTGASQ